MKELNIRSRITKFIETLPNVVSVKAYGSSIAYQAGYKENEKKQVDLIVIVDDIKEFYDENLKKNKYMYKLTPRIYFKHAGQINFKHFWLDIPKGNRISYSLNSLLQRCTL